MAQVAVMLATVAGLTAATGRGKVVSEKQSNSQVDGVDDVKDDDNDGRYDDDNDDDRNDNNDTEKAGNVIDGWRKVMWVHVYTFSTL